MCYTVNYLSKMNRYRPKCARILKLAFPGDIQAPNPATWSVMITYAPGSEEGDNGSLMANMPWTQHLNKPINHSLTVVG